MVVKLQKQRRKQLRAKSANLSFAPLNARESLSFRQHTLHKPLSALARILGEFTLIVDSQGTILNALIEKSANTPPFAAPLVGEDIPSLVGEKNYQLLAQAFDQVLISGRKQYAEYHIELPDGRRWFHFLLVPLHHINGGPNRIALVLKDVTARKESHHKLRKSEALLLQAEELARLGSFQVDLRTYSMIWSRQLFRNVSLDPRRGITWPQFLKMVHPEDRDRLVHDFEQSVIRKEILDGEFRCILANGDVRTLHRRAIPLYDDAGAPLALVGMSQDVTERKRSEEHLRNREALLSQAEQLANLGSWEWNLETSQITWSDHRFRLMGKEPGAFCPTIESFWRTLHPDDLDPVRAQFRTAIDQARPLEYEARFVLADGRVRTLHTRGVPIVNSEGRTIRLAGMAQDVTERRNEEDRLRRSEALLVQAEEIANVGSWEYDVKSSRTILSQQLLRMYGLASQDQWDEERFWSRVLLPDADAVRAQCVRAIQDCKPFEFTTRYRMPDGVVRVYHLKAKPRPAEDGSTERVLGVVRDITEHTRTEEDLRRLSQQLIRTRDSERRQLARELHESAGQSLAALKMSLGNLREVLPEENAVAFEHLDAARGFAEDAIREVRVISYLMYPPLLDDAGLAPALNWYIRGFAERSGIKASVETHSSLGRYPQEIESAIFCIVQEALTNVHRYSGSPTVVVRLAHEDASIRTEIEDQGCGLPILAPMRGRSAVTGVGIAGMRERVKQLNGSFEIISTPGSGTVVRAILPIPRQQQPASKGGLASEDSN